MILFFGAVKLLLTESSSPLRATGRSASICGNSGSGVVQEMGKWIEYMNFNGGPFVAWPMEMILVPLVSRMVLMKPIAFCIESNKEWNELSWQGCS